MKKSAMWMVGVVAAAAAVSGCDVQRSQPRMTFMPDMAYQPSVRAQSEQALRLPVPGTVTREGPHERLPASMEEAGKLLKNPLPKTVANLKKGREQFNIYCMVCHGEYGEGNGSVVPKYPQPPTLQSDKIRGYPDGNIYYIISYGQNLMPSYATQVDPEDRWAIVHYIRALQRAKKPTAEDLKNAQGQ